MSSSFLTLLRHDDGSLEAACVALAALPSNLAFALRAPRAGQHLIAASGRSSSDNGRRMVPYDVLKDVLGSLARSKKLHRASNHQQIYMQEADLWAAHDVRQALTFLGRGLEVNGSQWGVMGISFWPSSLGC